MFCFLDIFWATSRKQNASKNCNIVSRVIYIMNRDFCEFFGNIIFKIIAHRTKSENFFCKIMLPFVQEATAPMTRLSMGKKPYFIPPYWAKSHSSSHPTGHASAETIGIQAHFKSSGLLNPLHGSNAKNVKFIYSWGIQYKCYKSGSTSIYL